MPRKSIQALITTPTRAPQIWPSPPASCTPRQKELWQSLVTSREASYWDPCAKVLLHQMVVHCESFERIGVDLERELQAESVDDVRVMKLIAMRGCESKSAASHATKLRLCAQSRFTPENARRAAIDADLGQRARLLWGDAPGGKLRGKQAAKAASATRMPWDD